VSIYPFGADAQKALRERTFPTRQVGNGIFLFRDSCAEQRAFAH
jgi:hypothetical protein